MKLQQGQFRCIRKRFYTERVFMHWHRLPREVVTAPSLPECKKHLDNTLRNMVSFLDGPVWSQELDLMILVGPFQLRIFCDSMIPEFINCIGGNKAWIEVSCRKRRN